MYPNTVVELSISLPQVNRVCLYSRRLGFGQPASPEGRFYWEDPNVQLDFKIVSSPLLLLEAEGIFLPYLLHLHCENGLKLLEVHLTMFWEAPYDWVSPWLVCTEPPAIHQLQVKVSFWKPAPSPRRLPSLNISALISHNSLQVPVCLFYWGLRLWCPPLASASKKSCGFVSVFSFLLVWIK